METLNKTVGQIVREDYRAADVFEKFGIDFCCAGKKLLDTSCVENGVKKEEVEAALNNLFGLTDEVMGYENMALSELAEHIVNTHHKYIEETAPVLLKYLEKITDVHGKHNPELNEIYALFKGGVGELIMHMHKEELLLFPYIKKLEDSKGKDHGNRDLASFGSILNPITVLMSEHEAEGDRFKRIAELTRQYTPPAHACNTFRVSYAKLQEFEKDLHLHIHLENNILFPKAMELEKDGGK